MLHFYWRCLKVAFAHSWDWGMDISSTILGVVIPLVVHFARPSEQGERKMNDLFWEIPVAAVGALFLRKLLVAPYTIFREEAEKRKKADEKAKELQNKLDERISYVLKIEPQPTLYGNAPIAMNVRLQVSNTCLLPIRVKVEKVEVFTGDHKYSSFDLIPFVLRAGQSSSGFPIRQKGQWKQQSLTATRMGSTLEDS